MFLSTVGGDVINISASNVIVRDFTIQNSGSEFGDSGIQINFRYINISINNNKIFYNEQGIQTFYSWDDLIEKNNISFNEIGVWAHSSSITISDNILGYNRLRGIVIFGDETEVYNNIIFGNLSDKYGDEGIEIEGNNNIISGNTITKSNEAIILASANDNKIIGNNICSNQNFLFMGDSNRNLISQNNFIDNEREGKGNTFYDSFNNKWDINYWSRPRIFPYFIFGKIWIEIFGGFYIRWFNIDWHPAKKPYNI